MRERERERLKIVLMCTKIQNMTDTYRHFCTQILVLGFFSEKYVNTWNTEVLERDFLRS